MGFCHKTKIVNRIFVQETVSNSITLWIRLQFFDEKKSFISQRRSLLNSRKEIDVDYTAWFIHGYEIAQQFVRIAVDVKHSGNVSHGWVYGQMWATAVPFLKIYFSCSSDHSISELEPFDMSKAFTFSRIFHLRYRGYSISFSEANTIELRVQSSQWYSSSLSLIWLMLFSTEFPHKYCLMSTINYFLVIFAIFHAVVWFQRLLFTY